MSNDEKAFDYFRQGDDATDPLNYTFFKLPGDVARHCVEIS